MLSLSSFVIIIKSVNINLRGSKFNCGFYDDGRKYPASVASRKSPAGKYGGQSEVVR